MRRPQLARVLMGVSLIMAWATVGRVLRVEGTPFPRGLSAWIDLSILGSDIGFGVGTVLVLGAVFAFVGRRSESVAALVLAGLFALFAHVQNAQWPGESGVNRAVILPGAVMVAYALGHVWAKRNDLGAADSERVSVHAASGVAAATYFLAGYSKLVSSGAAWASGSNLAFHIAVHSHSGVDWIRPLRAAMVERLWLCQVFGVGTILIECGFLMFVFPALRRPLAAAAGCMHVGIAVVMGLHHYDWMFMALGLGFYVLPPSESLDD